MDLDDLIEMMKPISFGLIPTIFIILIIWSSIGADSYTVDAEYLNGMITILGILFAFWIFLLGRSPEDSIKRWQQKHLIIKPFLYIPIPLLFLSIFGFYYSSLHSKFSYIIFTILTFFSLINLFLLTTILYFIYYKGIED
jgi:small-conductance mechanosensitive channel